MGHRHLKIIGFCIFGLGLGQAQAADEATPSPEAQLEAGLASTPAPILLFDASNSKAKPKLFFYGKFPTEKFKDSPLLLDALSAKGVKAKKLGQKVTTDSSNAATKPAEPEAKPKAAVDPKSVVDPKSAVTSESNAATPLNPVPQAEPVKE